MPCERGCDERAVRMVDIAGEDEDEEAIFNGKKQGKIEPLVG